MYVVISTTMKIYNYILFLTIILGFSSVYAVRAQEVYPSLIITEVMPNPIGDDTKYEWIEVQNTTSVEQSLVDWSLNGKTLSDFKLEPNEVILFVRSQDAFPEAYQTDVRVLNADFSLVNSGGTVKLENSKSGEHHHFEYTQSQEGRSFELLEGECGMIALNPTGHTVGQINTSCNSPTPTPTSVIPTPTNQVEKLSGMVVISSLNPFPEEGDEWVELKSIDSKTVDLSSWKLTDASNKSFIITTLVLSPGETIKVFPKNVSLNNDGDTVTLTDRNGKVVDSFTYSKVSKGQIVARNQESEIEIEEQREASDSTQIINSLSRQEGVVLSTNIQRSVDYNQHFKKPVFYKMGDYRQ